MNENTRADIEALRNEAAWAGDTIMVQLCLRAIDGNTNALAECLRVLDCAKAQEGSDK